MGIRMSKDTLKTISVEQAGKQYFGLGRGSSYAAARGDIPTIRIGRMLRVPVKALESMLEVSPNTQTVPKPRARYRPKSEERRVPIGSSVRLETKETLEELAKKNNITLSYMIEKLLVWALSAGTTTRPF